MPKLTETFASKLPLAKEGTEKFWDTEIKGIVLYVGKRSKTWYYQRDVGGRTQRALIGRYPVITAATARQAALGFALEWGRGAGKAIQIGAPTLENAMVAYLARPKLRSEAHRTILRQQFELHLKEWMKLPLNEISKGMVVAKHRSLGDRPSAANHLLKYFRTVWNHARRTVDLRECPTMAIEWFEERPEGTIIADLTEWRRVVEALPNPIHETFFKLLLFTGLRKTEALTLEWKNINEDRIHLPMTKNGRSFDLPILPVHHEILAPVRGLHRRWVFPSPKTEHDPIDTDALQRRLWAIWGEAYQAYLDMREAQPHGALWLDLRDPKVQRERDQIAEGSRKKTVTEIVAEVIGAWLDERRPADEVMVDASGLTLDGYEGDETPMVRAMVTAEEATENLQHHPLLQAYRNLEKRTFGKALTKVPGWQEVGRVRRFGQPPKTWYGRGGYDGAVAWVPAPEEEDDLLA